MHTEDEPGPAAVGAARIVGSSNTVGLEIEVYPLTV